jgi:hypothetical protein
MTTKPANTPLTITCCMFMDSSSLLLFVWMGGCATAGVWDGTNTGANELVAVAWPSTWLSDTGQARDTRGPWPVMRQWIYLLRKATRPALTH